MSSREVSSYLSSLERNSGVPTSTNNNYLPTTNSLSDKVSFRYESSASIEASFWRIQSGDGTSTMEAMQFAFFHRLARFTDRHSQKLTHPQVKVFDILKSRQNRASLD